MKITLVKEIEASSPQLILTMFLDSKDKPSLHISLEFTCSECGGHGCRNKTSDFKCSGGTVSQTLEPENLNKWLDDVALTRVRVAVAELHNSLNGTMYQLR